MVTRNVFGMNADVLKALAHPLRMEVISVLQKRELCFSDILEETGGIKSNLSQHLSIMVDKGILSSRKDSRCNYFRLASPKVLKVCGLITEIRSERLAQQKELLKKRKS